jgi:hypothetical protein
VKVTILNDVSSSYSFKTLQVQRGLTNLPINSDLVYERAAIREKCSKKD